MRAVHVGVCHDNYAVIAELGTVEGLFNAGAQGCYQRPYLFVSEHLVGAGLLHVEDLALQGEDGLELPVPTHLCGTPRRLTLDYVDFAPARVSL